MPRSRQFPSRRRDRGRFLKKDREGVASTIGTMMALLIFLTLFTMFTNSYLPLWMKDNERNHMTSVLDEMGTLKGKISMLEALSSTTQQSTISMFQSFQLGAAGVPVFVAPTVGVLSMNNSLNSQSHPGVGVSVSIWGTSNPGLLWSKPMGGMVQLYAPNRYYVPQWVAFENNGILVKQQDGQSMNVAPGISILGSPGMATLAINQVDILGANNSVTGTGSGGLEFQTLYVQSDSRSAAQLAGDRVVVNITTYNGLAFFNYYKNLLQQMDSTFVKISATQWRGPNFDLQIISSSISQLSLVKLIIYHPASIDSTVSVVKAVLS